MKIRDLGEIELIRRLAKNFRLDRSVIKGSGDDTAVIKWTKDTYMLFTCDMVSEGVHFDLKKARPFEIGWKALARNISDIAAMGGIPRYAVVSLAIAPRSDVSIADNICRGIKAAADKFKVNIVGGDMARSEKIVMDISLIGQVEKSNLVLRSGAKRGDIILVTGALGGSIKGKHLNFTPRIKESRALVMNNRINSMIDVSDGLALDLGRILKASNAGARLYEKAIPLSKDAASVKNALYDGEDFELLFTMSVKEAGKFFKTTYIKMRTPVTIIGEVLDKREGYRIIDGKGRSHNLPIKGFTHF